MMHEQTWRNSSVCVLLFWTRCGRPLPVFVACRLLCLVQTTKVITEMTHAKKQQQPKWCKKRDNWPRNWPWSIPLLITATSSSLGSHCAPAMLTQHRGADGQLICRFIYANAQHMLKCGRSAGLTGSWQDTDKSVWTVKPLQWCNTMKWEVVDKTKCAKN